MTAPTATNYAIGEHRGVDLSTAYSTAGTSDQVPGPPFSLGTHVVGNRGGEFVFCKAVGPLAQYQCVAIDQNFNARTATISRVLQRGQIGFTQVTLTSGQFGFIAIRGENIGALTKLSSLANVKLYVSGTSPGVLSSTSIRTTCSLVTGVILTSSATSAAIGGNVSGAMTVLATWPRAME